jgi:hypothetical protein
VHAPSEKKSDEAKDSFYEELEQVYDHFPKLRGIFRKWEGSVGTGWSGLRIGTGGGHL